jgi:hypothetical protein
MACALTDGERPAARVPTRTSVIRVGLRRSKWRTDRQGSSPLPSRSAVRTTPRAHASRRLRTGRCSCGTSGRRKRASRESWPARRDQQRRVQPDGKTRPPAATGWCISSTSTPHPAPRSAAERPQGAVSSVRSRRTGRRSRPGTTTGRFCSGRSRQREQRPGGNYAGRSPTGAASRSASTGRRSRSPPEDNSAGLGHGMHTLLRPLPTAGRLWTSPFSRTGRRSRQQATTRCALGRCEAGTGTPAQAIWVGRVPRRSAGRATLVTVD